mgnify:CR=1 FL=1
MTTQQYEDSYGVTAGSAAVEEGTYVARFLAHEPVQGQFKMQAKLQLVIIDPDGPYDGVELTAYANLPEQGNLTPLMKLYSFFDALMARDPMEYAETTGKRLSLSGLVGRSCRIHVEEVSRPDGSTWSKVSKFSRMKKSQAGLAAEARKIIKPKEDMEDELPFE